MEMHGKHDVKPAVPTVIVNYMKDWHTMTIRYTDRYRITSAMITLKLKCQHV